MRRAAHALEDAGEPGGGCLSDLNMARAQGSGREYDLVSRLPSLLIDMAFPTTGANTLQCSLNA